jgi:5,6-dimethylbenzimidazole synthase
MTLSITHYRRLLDVLRWRRDVRHFRTDPIPPEVMARIEAAVDAAPSVGNSRPWRIVRVKGVAAREAVIRSFTEANERASLAYEDAERTNYLGLKLAGLREAPVHLAFFTDPDPAEGRGLGRQTMPETLAYSTVMAIHTLWLAARALNVGVGWVSILEPQAVRAALDVPSHWQLTGYLCLGYPYAAEELPELHCRGWQENTPSVWLDR